MSGSGVRLTPVRTVVSIAVVAASVAWALLRILESRSVDALTAVWLNVPWSLPVGLAGVAVGLGVSARAWTQRLHGTGGARPVDPLAAARTVAAAKASALVGALVGGAYAGYALFLLSGEDSELRTSRTWGCAATVVTAVAVVVAAMVLERVLRLPDDMDDSASLA